MVEVYRVLPGALGAPGHIYSTWAASWRWVSVLYESGGKMLYSVVLDLIDVVPTGDLIKVVGHHRGTRISIQK